MSGAVNISIKHKIENDKKLWQLVAITENVSNFAFVEKLCHRRDVPFRSQDLLS